MALSYKHKVLIDSRDTDGLGRCKASALLGHLQEAATQAAEHGGFGRDVLLRQANGFWMITRVWVQLSRPLHWGEELTVHTWHRGGKSAVSYRDYDLYVGDEHVGEGVSAWVLANRDTHKLIRLSTVDIMSQTDGGELCKDVTLSKLRTPESLTEVENRIMRYSDTDINGHVNNTRYADFACDVLGEEMLRQDKFLASFQIGYQAECRPGDVLTMQMGDLEDGYYVCGLDESGKSRFEASLHFENTEP